MSKTIKYSYQDLPTSLLDAWRDWPREEIERKYPNSRNQHRVLLIQKELKRRQKNGL